ncbi:hypothetical protein [Corallococcus sp. CA049B]|uniref:hypothetical protein n=1 Tax=Corallococcus sp. CA049B TaxID=2316730 RepID=UPI0013154650|nr:hypothetical protein [Corallococcus sp. CA049B]
MGVEINEEVFWVQKAGSSVAEYEDSFSSKAPARKTGESFRFAISDGATESSFSGVWARLLVSLFSESNDTMDVPSLLASARPLWAAEVGRKELPWYAAVKAQDGAFASFLSLHLRNGRDGQEHSAWRAQAVGDSCLVQVRAERIMCRFPLEHSSEFGSSPFLLSSNLGDSVALEAHLRIAEGTCEPGDTLYLMTDALACWFMAEDEAGRAPWRVLRDLNTTDQAEAFDAMIARLRRDGTLKNDDSTLMRIDVF